MPYEVGIARFSEIARGQIAGDATGMLKLLFHRDTRKLLGVHVIGESATEIIHIGQAVMALGGTIDYFRDTVFNYPTMAECYKVAALDGLNKLSLWAEAETCGRASCRAGRRRRRWTSTPMLADARCVTIRDVARRVDVVRSVIA